MLSPDATYDSTGVSIHMPAAEPRMPDDGRVIPALRRGDLSDVQIDPSNIEHVKQGQPIPGLKEITRMDITDGTPCYIMGQHSSVLFALAEALHEGKIQVPVTLINADMHGDYTPPRRPTYLIDPATFRDLTRMAVLNRQTDIDEFIYVAQLMQMVDTVVWIDSEFAADNQPTELDLSHGPGPLLQSRWQGEHVQRILRGEIPRERVAVTIDIDYFTNMTDADEIEREMVKMRELIAHAGVVMIATSPGYIDQQRAIELTKQLLSPLV